MLELRLWQLVLQQVISFEMENKKLSENLLFSKSILEGIVRREKNYLKKLECLKIKQNSG